MIVAAGPACGQTARHRRRPPGVWVGVLRRGHRGPVHDRRPLARDDAPVLAPCPAPAGPRWVGHIAWARPLAAAVLVALATAGHPSFAVRGQTAGPVKLSSISPAPTWQGRPGLDLNWQPAYRHASALRRQGFASPSGRAMELQVLYPVDQTAERLMVTSTTPCCGPTMPAGSRPLLSLGRSPCPRVRWA